MPFMYYKVTDYIYTECNTDIYKHLQLKGEKLDFFGLETTCFGNGNDIARESKR